MQFFSIRVDNLNIVPENGRFHGWNVSIWMLINSESEEIFMEVLQEQPDDIKEIVTDIINECE